MLRVAALLIIASSSVVGFDRPIVKAPDWQQQGGVRVRSGETPDGPTASASVCSGGAESFYAVSELSPSGVNRARGMFGTQAASDSSTIPEQARQKLVHELGHAFIVFREPVQAELKLTADQTAKLDQYLRGLLPDVVPLFEKWDGLSHEEQDRERGDYLPKALAKLEPTLKNTLTESQRIRLSQLVNQREGLFGGVETLDALHVTPEQRQQFMAVVQQTQQTKIQALMQEEARLHTEGGDPADLQRRMLAMRKDLESNLEALLTDAQRKQWKEMRGEPVEQSVLFELSHG